MADTKFSIGDDNQLINLVVVKDPLYDLQFDLHKNSNVPNNIWRAILIK